MTHKADRLVSAYVAMRDDLADKEKAHKEFKAHRKEEMLQLADALQKIMDDTGVESVKTSAGTAFRATKDFVGIDDWPTVLEFVAGEALSGAEDIITDLTADDVPTDEIVTELLRSVLESDAFGIFNKAVNKAMTKEYMGDHEGLTPPGVNYGTKIEIQIRRPK